MEQTILHSINSIKEGIIDKSSSDPSSGLEGIILTGSMASWLNHKDTNHSPSWGSIPDINLYAFVDSGSKKARMNSYIGESIHNAQKELQNINFLVDLHPTANYVGTPDERYANIQLTTRSIALDNPDEIADYCWKGWKSNYHTLYPEKSDFFSRKDIEIQSPRRDERWLRNMYLALSSYGNFCTLSPLIDPGKQKERMFDEGYRYLKEIAKDGVQIALSEEEFQENKGDSVLKNWRNQATEFYEHKYGEDASNIIELLNFYEDNYWKKRKESGEGLNILENAIKLRDIVYERGFLKRLDEISNNSPRIKKMFGDLVHWY